MTKREAFFHFLHPQYLYDAAIFFAAITAYLVSLIYLYLYLKKRNHRVINRINEQVNSWIGEILTEREPPDLTLSADLQLYLKKKRNREFVIDNLIKVRKNLKGLAVNHIVDLYHRLGLKEDSLSRFRSVVWHQKAKGIYELYMMNQEGELPEISRYTNSKNEFVRMEAQTAIVGFLGFEGLSFLDTLEYPLHEWQQLKLLEQLSTQNSVTMERLPLWLRSENVYVVHFALKLADIYRQMEVHDIVVECLESHLEKLRYQAIKTLGRIAGADTGFILIRRYPFETSENKRNILRQLQNMTNAQYVPFLEAVFAEGDDGLKLEAARALAGIKDPVDLFNEYDHDETVSSILKQVQYELRK